MSSAIIIGGTKGIGMMLAEIMATRGDKVTIAGRDSEVSAAAARKIGPNVTGIAVDIAKSLTVLGRCSTWCWPPSTVT
jgi:NAD(P)-dependent dehydrogenase (short-subunit alcohol dehydrogenase family)